MKYTTLGRKSGLRVSELALGTGNFGTGWGHGAESAEAKKIFDMYANAGGNFIDTANGYQSGQSETMLGDFISSDRDHFVIATKYTNGTNANARISEKGNNRKNMMRSVDESLRRLKTDHIDLFWTHISDGMTPMEEIMRGFDDLVSAGKIHYAGLSNFPAWRIARADIMAELRGWAPIVAIQTEYSLAERTAERELIPMADALGLAITTWSPLGGGFLTGKYREMATETRLEKLGMLVHTEKNEKDTLLINTIFDIAKEANATATHIAIAWLLYKASHSSTALIPILGSRTADQLNATLGSLDVVLNESQISRLDAASDIALGVPHEQIRSAAKNLAAGNNINVFLGSA
jgi:aryl-alcohol dehydrogenase-like predicted oxidoreductase